MFQLLFKGLTLTAALATVMLLGAWREPALRSQSERQLVAAWIAQQPAAIEDTNKWGFKGIAFNQNYVALRPTPNRDIVLGSSHQMFVRKPLMSGTTTNAAFFNHWITGLNRGMDVLPAVYQAYRDSGLPPRKVLLGIDPWLLQTPSALPTDAQGQLVEAKQYVITQFVTRFQRLLPYSLPYADRLSNPLRIDSIMNADGSFMCASNLIVCVWPNIAEQHQLVQKNIGKVDAIFGAPVDPALQQQFEQFVMLMLADGVQVAFVETPFHPLASAAAMQNPIATQTDVYFRAIAQKHHIPFVGSYNPADCKLDETDFVDVDHLNETGTAKLLTQPNCKFGAWEQFLKP